MEIMYKQNEKGGYYLCFPGMNVQGTYLIPFFIKLPKDKYEEFLRKNGARLELDGHMYFYVEQQAKDSAMQLNVMFHLTRKKKC